MKILMVCLGNICRSPLAEGILRHKSRHLNIEVDSAGTGAWHSGEAPDKRSVAIAQKYGIDISGQRARLFLAEDFERFDRIYVMDQSNYKNVCRLAPNEQALAKVQLILNEIHPDKNLEVPDPYYGGHDGFEQVYQMLDQSCEQLLRTLHQTSQALL